MNGQVGICKAESNNASDMGAACGLPLHTLARVPIQTWKCTSSGRLVAMVFLRKEENGNSCMVGDFIEELASEILEVGKCS